LPLGGHLALPGDTSGCHSWVGDAADILWVKARDAAEYPAMHRHTHKITHTQMHTYTLLTFYPKPLMSNN